MAESFPPDGNGLHTCTVCKKREAWSDSWCWYGSYKLLDDFGGDTVPKLCSEACKAKWAKKNAVMIEVDSRRKRSRS